MKFKFLIFFTVFTVSVFGVTEIDFEDFWLKNSDVIWTLNQEQIKIVSKIPLRSQDKFDNVMRYYSKDFPEKVTIRKHPVSEIIFNFEKRKLQSIIISVYNRGDNGKIDEHAFRLLNSKIEAASRTLSKSKTPKIETRKFDRFAVEALTFNGKNADFIIRRNRRGKYPEYIQFSILPPASAKSLKESLRTAAGKNQMQLNLIHDSQTGDAYLDIPMVNQGNKGYCVGATVERILKYYGSSIDQQIIAQLAESDSYKGTNVRKLYNVLKKNDSKLKIKVDKIFHDDSAEQYEDIEKFTSQYNNIAKKQKRLRVNFKEFTSRRKKSRTVNFPALISAFEYDIFSAAKCRNVKILQKFEKMVSESLTKGIPLVWITYVFKNTAPNTSIENISMHMRIINGFNRQQKKIIFTDSWGKGHEKKYMSLDDAWTHTLMLIQITPK